MAIDLSIENGVATVTINRPERKNAILLAMRTEIETAFLKCQDDDAVRVIIPVSYTHLTLPTNREV